MQENNSKKVKEIKKKEKKVSSPHFCARNVIIALVAVVIGVSLMFVAFTDRHEHVWGKWQVTKLVSCVEDGKEVSACECGERRYRPIESAGEHVFDSWTVAKVPTCEEDGYQERKCTCGFSETEVIPARGHRFSNGVCRTCFKPQPTEE